MWEGILDCFVLVVFFFFFQVEDGIRDHCVTGVRRVLFRSGAQLIALTRAAKSKPVPKAQPKIGKKQMERAKALAALTNSKIGRASVGKECRSRWSPYH